MRNSHLRWGAVVMEGVVEQVVADDREVRDAQQHLRASFRLHQLNTSLSHATQKQVCRTVPPVMTSLTLAPRQVATPQSGVASAAAPSPGADRVQPGHGMRSRTGGKLWK